MNEASPISPLERIARSMCAKAVELDMDDGQSWLVLARIALESIREPSYAMLDAGDIPGCGVGTKARDDAIMEVKFIWQDMIDAALDDDHG